jgi:hypothetical protein
VRAAEQLQQLLRLPACIMVELLQMLLLLLQYVPQALLRRTS